MILYSISLTTMYTLNNWTGYKICSIEYFARAFERDSENEAVFVTDLNTVEYVQHNGAML